MSSSDPSKMTPAAPIKISSAASGGGPLTPDHPESSPVGPETIASRIRRAAGPSQVHAHPHTIASQSFSRSREILAAELLSPGGGDHGPSPLARSAAAEDEGKDGGLPPGSPGAVLKTLSKNVHGSQDLSRTHMAKFLSGFRRFHQNYFSDHTDLFATLQKGQAPKTLLIGCCDSRCDPAIITDCDPGDLFIVRNIAALVPPYQENEVGGLHGTSAALEFAVKALKVENIIVMGHTICGGIKALLQGAGEGMEFVHSWVKIGQAAKEKTLKNFPDADERTQQRACEHASILVSLENLISYPWIREALTREELTINGWYFDFERGELLAYMPETNSFEKLIQSDGSTAEHGTGSGKDSAKRSMGTGTRATEQEA
ncbi:hypothetical protein HK104_010869 [Borealophlyctis nickersoniae]|nr:hypothetical protein HK104_010869 [Borealophlyctis nickersoniae]